MLRNEPRHGVGRSARREWHDQLDRPIGIALGVGDAGRAGAQADRNDG
jgi:hypothetical protein